MLVCILPVNYNSQGRLILIFHTMELSHAGLSQHPTNKQKIVIGSIYQHPKSDRTFYEILKKQLESLNNKGKEV